MMDLTVILDFFNQSLPSSLLANGVTELLKGLFSKLKSKKSPDLNTPLTRSELEEVLEEYSENEIAQICNEIKRINSYSHVVQINQNSGGNNAQTVYGNISLNFN